ncbi:hypothetical protein GGI35DRAFT_279261 [Trichoderma velutinum]
MATAQVPHLPLEVLVLPTRILCVLAFFGLDPPAELAYLSMDKRLDKGRRLSKLEKKKRQHRERRESVGSIDWILAKDAHYTPYEWTGPSHPCPRYMYLCCWDWYLSLATNTQAHQSVF